MWIECKINQCLFLLNSKAISSIDIDDEKLKIIINMMDTQIFYFRNIEDLGAMFRALKMAIQGLEVDLGGLGYFKPLRADQIEEQYKYMRYRELINTLSEGAGE